MAFEANAVVNARWDQSVGVVSRNNDGTYEPGVEIFQKRPSSTSKLLCVMDTENSTALKG